jgi:hypothetical protein
VAQGAQQHPFAPDAPGETRPADDPAQQLALESWIKTAGFGLNPDQPDPGRVTVRRLNRTEYRNTIRDLLGVDVNVDDTLAADDIGYGFDNIADVLTLSPMRMEKFLEAAQTIVKKGGAGGLAGDGRRGGARQGVPHRRRRQERRPDDVLRRARGQPQLLGAGGGRLSRGDVHDGGRRRQTRPRPVQGHGAGRRPGDLPAQPPLGGLRVSSTTSGWCTWEPGTHQITFHLQPLLGPEKQVTAKMDFKLLTVEVQGPLNPKDWQPPPNYAKFFPRSLPPTDPVERRAYAREILSAFSTKAYRRPVSPATLDRLVKLAENIYQIPGTTFEMGVSRAMVAILASPRFLFRVEESAPAVAGQPFVDVDEYALASRLSYFLWSSMPDDELFKLAAQGALRKNLGAQVRRMLADPKADAFVENFAGQWLRSRDILRTPIDRVAVLEREGIKTPAGRAAQPTDVTPEQREAMKAEAEAYVGYVARNNRSVLELLDSNYAFVNATLASYYGMPAGTAKGTALQKVTLPPADPRGGGVLTMGSVLAVTSNPTRTSPVKRGKWILENILGAPPAPPPPNVPALEETLGKIADHVPSQREVLALHRKDPLCASCHDKMDPLGLALENFNALGLYRTAEMGQPVDAAGELFTGEPFKNIRELKHLLVTTHRDEFYRTFTEKLLIYALGRGVEYYDMPTVDKIVARLDQTDGKFEELLLGVVESAPFEERRPVPNPLTPEAKTAMVADNNTSTNEPKPQ